MIPKIDFSHRSYEKELLDGKDIPFEDIEQNMRELDFINTWLGGHGISRAGLKHLLKDRKSVTICEIGCGGGDNLRALGRYCRHRHIEVRMIGVDNNRHCVSVAGEKWDEENGEAEWVCSDYREVFFEDRKPDIIFSSLFCHHFTNEELIEQLRWMEKNAQTGWFINDLHRHRLAYYLIRRLTAWWSRSYLVKKDAPLSVLRGFTRKEWKELLDKAEIRPYSLKWKWAFRWLVTKEYVNGK